MYAVISEQGKYLHLYFVRKIMEKVLSQPYVDQFQHWAFHGWKQSSLLYQKQPLVKSNLWFNLLDLLCMGPLTEADCLWALCQDQNLVKANQCSHSLWWDNLLLYKCYLPHSNVRLVPYCHWIQCGLWSHFWIGHQQWSILQFLLLGGHNQHYLWCAWKLWHQHLQVKNIFFEDNYFYFIVWMGLNKKCMYN